MFLPRKITSEIVGNDLMLTMTFWSSWQILAVVSGFFCLPGKSLLKKNIKIMEKSFFNEKLQPRLKNISNIRNWVLKTVTVAKTVTVFAIV